MKRKKKKQNSDRIDEKKWYEEKRRSFSLFASLWKILRVVLIYTAALVLVAGTIYTAVEKVREYLFDPMDPKNSDPVTITVESGSSLSRVSKQLEEAGVIRSSTVFKYYADFMGAGQKIQSGKYSFSKTQSVSEIVSELVSGDGLPRTTQLTIIPGWTVEDIGKYLVTAGLLADDVRFLDLCNDADTFSDYYFVNQMKDSANRSSLKYCLEGYLSPNTYEVYTASDAETIIRKLLSQTESAYISAYEERADIYGFTMNDVLALASMIEKEAKKSDFSKVSAVFHNRLDKKMSLDSDATIKYVTGTKKISLNSEDIALSSPYNTYKNKGLPPGPICNPSMDAVVAALYPDETYVSQGYLYFCSTDPDTGTLHFSKTLEEHEAAVAMYRPLWEEYDKSKGWN